MDLSHSTHFHQEVAVNSLSEVLVGVNDAVVRFTIDGVLDVSFGDNGYRRLRPLSTGWEVRALAIQEDDKIVVFGTVFRHTRTVFGSGRLGPDGDRDVEFAGDGITFTAFPGGCVAALSSGALDGQGRIVAVGAAGHRWQTDLALCRYLP